MREPMSITPHGRQPEGIGSVNVASSAQQRAAPGFDVEDEQRRTRRRAQPPRAVVQRRIGKGNALSDRDHAPGRANGAAFSLLVANGAAALVLAANLMHRDATAPLNRSPWRLHISLVRDILRVGVPASMSPVLSNASIAVATVFVGGFGTAALAGYGVAARLEYILVPIAFGFGTALTAMVATSMGAGNAMRALRVAWIGAAVVAAITGGIGLVTAIAPGLWMHLFTQDAAVREFGASYLRIVGAFYGLYGFGLALFFASQGAGRMFWPLAGSVARLVIVALGGWVCVHVLQTSENGLFVVIAISLAIYGLIIAGAIRLGAWTR